MKENKRELRSYFLNHPKDKAGKHHPRLAWAHHVHGLMIDYFEDVLQTETFCENTQMRNWQRANQMAIAALEDTPAPYSLTSKELYVQEILALRRDLEALDHEFTNLSAHKYLTWSGLYFEHFPSEMFEFEPLNRIDILAEQAVILTHPHMLPAQAETYKRYFANLFIKQLAWDYPLSLPEELPGLSKHSLSLNLALERVQAQIAYNQDKARAKLRLGPAGPEPTPPPLREISSKKISELQTLLSFPKEDSWSKLKEQSINFM
jgi:hypothetical protein